MSHRHMQGAAMKTSHSGDVQHAPDIASPTQVQAHDNRMRRVTARKDLPRVPASPCSALRTIVMAGASVDAAGEGWAPLSLAVMRRGEGGPLPAAATCVCAS